MNNDIFEQLRAKGYFDGPLTGYLSHQLPPDLPPWKAVVRLALQVGIVGGIAMAIVFSGATLLLNPYLTDFPWECVKLFAGFSFGFSYLGAIFLLGTGFFQIFILRVLHKPISIERFLAFRAGELAGFLLFFYGACWWWTLAISSETYSLFSWQTLGLFFILFAVSLYVAQLLNHLTQYRNFRQRTKRRELLGLSLFAILVLIFLQTYQSFSEPTLSWTTLVPRPEKTPAPLLILGIDGLTEENLKYYIEKQQLPHFTKLLQNSVPIHLKGFEGDQTSEWITLMTGHSTMVHGVKGLFQNQYPGNIQPLGPEHFWTFFFPFLKQQTFITTHQRRVKFLWEIASEAGINVTAINHWGTWPAEPIQGSIFSDRLLPAHTLQHFSGKECFPESLREIVKPLFLSAKQQSEQIEEKLAQPAYFADYFTEMLLEYALAQQPQLAVAYFQGLDILQQKMNLWPVEPSKNIEKKFLLQQSYYQFLDQLLGKYLNSSYRIILLSGPGFFSHNEGIAFLFGASFSSSNSPTQAHPLEMMPTFLQALGLPRSQKMSPALPVFHPLFLKQFPPRLIPSFGKRVPFFDKITPPHSLEEYYRSLGYL